MALDHEDLFWALRGGGGGNFGVVTSATLALSPAPAQVVYAEYAFGLDAASLVTQMFLNNTDVEFSFFLLFVSPAAGKVDVLLQGIWNGDVTQGLAKLQPFTNVAKASGGSASVKAMSYVQAKAAFSGGLHDPIPGKQKSAFIPFNLTMPFATVRACVLAACHGWCCPCPCPCPCRCGVRWWYIDTLLSRTASRSF
jgi:hypothetical protein